MQFNFLWRNHLNTRSFVPPVCMGVLNDYCRFLFGVLTFLKINIHTFSKYISQNKRKTFIFLGHVSSIVTFQHTYFWVKGVLNLSVLFCRSIKLFFCKTMPSFFLLIFLHNFFYSHSFFSCTSFFSTCKSINLIRNNTHTL